MCVKHVYAQRHLSAMPLFPLRWREGLLVIFNVLLLSVLVFSIPTYQRERKEECSSLTRCDICTRQQGCEWRGCSKLEGTCMLTTDYLPEEGIPMPSDYDTSLHRDASSCANLPVTVQWWRRVVTGSFDELYNPPITASIQQHFRNLYPHYSDPLATSARLNTIGISESQSSAATRAISEAVKPRVQVTNNSFIDAFNLAAWRIRTEVLLAWPPAAETVVVWVLFVFFALVVKQLAFPSTTTGFWELISCICIIMVAIVWMNFGKINSTA